MIKALQWMMENQKAKDQRKANPPRAEQTRVEQVMQHQNKHKMLLVPNDTDFDGIHYLIELD